MMRAGAISTSQRQSRTAYIGSMHLHLPLKIAKAWHQQARYCYLSFSTFQVCYLLKSSSTSEPLTLIYTVGHSETYAGPSRTKDRGCSHRVWFCSMITHVHVSRVMHAELAVFKWEQLDHPPCSPDMSPCDFQVFGPLKKTSEREVL